MTTLNDEDTMEREAIRKHVRQWGRPLERQQRIVGRPAEFEVHHEGLSLRVWEDREVPEGETMEAPLVRVYLADDSETHTDMVEVNGARLRYMDIPRIRAAVRSLLEKFGTLWLLEPWDATSIEEWAERALYVEASRTAAYDALFVRS